MAITNLFGQSIEFSPVGLVNLKIGNSYSGLSPYSPDNKLLIYNRGGHSAGISLVDSSDNGTTNISVIYSKAYAAPKKGLFIGNLSDSPVVIFNGNDMEKNFFLTPSGNVGISSDIYGIGGSQRLYAKLMVTGVGDSLKSFPDNNLSSMGLFIDAAGINKNKISLAAQTSGEGEASNGVLNTGLLGLASSSDTSHANGIGVSGLSYLKTTGFSIGMSAKSFNKGSGSSYGINIESKSLLGSTYGIASSANGGLTNFGVYSNIVTTLNSVSPSYGNYVNISNGTNANSIYGYYANINKNSGGSSAYGSYLDVNSASGINSFGNFIEASAINAPSFGTYSIGNGNNANYGVYGFANSGTQNIAIYGSLGENTGSTDYAGYFDGNVHVSGVLSKSSGTFKIDHPIDPENKTLSHSFVESPDMMNIYNGNIMTDETGIALVNLPSYFEALNENFRYQLTVLGKFSQAIVLEKIKGNNFKIKTSEPNTEVSWQVTGTRKDPFAKQNPIKVEEEKSSSNKGKYLNPKVFGKTSKDAIIQVRFEK